MIDLAEAETIVPGPKAELDELAAMARVRGRMLGIAEPPLRIGRYRILDRLGAGGMGLVYAARDDELDRAVAIKVLRRELASADSRQRFMREAQALARLSHPNVVQVYEVGHHDDDEVYIAMELVPGTTLRKWCAAQPRTWREIVRVFVGAGRGLAAAHRAGLVHRDFKPDNVIMSVNPSGNDEEERPRVVDFGVAHFDAEPASAAAMTMSWATMPSGSMTQPGVVMGTVAYMAPEQRDGRRADARADQYAFAVSMFEALHGHRPATEQPTTERAGIHDAPGHRGRKRTHATTRIATLVDADRKIPAWLRAVLERATATDPDDRWSSMDALLAELQRPRTKTWLALAAVATTALVATAVYTADRARTAARCDAEAAELATWWGGARSTAETRLAETGVGFFTVTWASASPRLDRYVDDWTTMRASVCRATRIDGTRSEPMLVAARACLDERRTWLEALVEIWSTAEPRDVHGVAPAAAALPPLGACDDPLQLQPRLDELERAGSLDAQRSARTRLLRADASRRAGRLAEALELATALAAEVDDDVLHAEVLILLGRLRGGEAGELPAAEALYQQAVVLATQSGRSDLVGDAAAKLVFMAGIGRRGFDDAKYWGELASAAFSNSNVPEIDARRASLTGNLGTVAAARGEYEVALDLHRQAIVVWEAAVGPEHFDTITAHENIAVDLSYLGRFEDAVQQYARILELRERVLGADHPSIAGTLDNLGSVLRSQGRFEDATAHHERSLAINLAVHGPEHPRVADSLENLAGDVSALGQPVRALELYSRALELERRARGDDTVEVARLLNNMAMPLAELGRHDEAIAACERALAIQGRVLGREHPDVSWSLYHLGDVLYQVGRFADSRRAHARAVAIREATMPAESPELAEARTDLGRAALAAGDAKAALDPLERAAKVLERPDAPPQWRARNRFTLAQALVATRGDRTRAHALARAAEAGFRELGIVADAEGVTAWLATQRPAG